MHLGSVVRVQVPCGIEIWTAGTARRLGAGLLREAMALRGRIKLASYDRLFPSEDLLPAGGVGNLIGAPLFKPARDEGRTVFVDLGTLEPFSDQCAYLSALGRVSRRRFGASPPYSR